LQIAIANRFLTPLISPFALSTIGGATVFGFAAFFASAAMMLEQSLGTLILAIVMIIGIATRFPLMADRTKPSGDTA